MENKNNIEVLASKISLEVLSFIRKWMQTSRAEDIEFHYYRMNLLTAMTNYDLSTSKIDYLINKANSKYKFEVAEVTSDKLMGEHMAKYLLSLIILSLNEEYSKLLEHEIDRVKSENGILVKKSYTLKNILSSH